MPAPFKDRVDELKLALRKKQRWFYNGEKLSEEAIVAAAMLEFMELDERAQAEVLDRRLKEMEAIFDNAGGMIEEELRVPRPKKRGTA